MRREGVLDAYLLDDTDSTKFARRALLPGFFTVMSSSLSLMAPPELHQFVNRNWLMCSWVGRWVGRKVEPCKSRCRSERR